VKDCMNIKLDFEEIKSEYLLDWLNLLCNTDKRYKKFIENFLEKENIFHSACRYQKYLREEEGRGREIKTSQIHEAIKKKDINTLNSIFQEIFIEPIDNEAIKYFMNYTEMEKFKVDDLIKLHKKDKDRGFWLTLKKLIY
jgi:hypothetical protein